MLTESQISKIRTRYSNGESLKSIAQDMDIAYCTTQDVALNRRYRDEEYAPPKKRSLAEMLEIIQVIKAKGFTYEQIAKSLNMLDCSTTSASIRNILNKTEKELQQ